MSLIKVDVNLLSCSLQLLCLLKAEDKTVFVLFVPVSLATPDRRQNSCCVVCSSKFVYPKQDTREDKADSSEDESAPRARQVDGKYDLFTQLDGTIADEICNLVLNGTSRIKILH